MRAVARVAALALVAGTIAATGGCSLPDLSEASFVSGLRVLGVQANPPEAYPGDTVSLTAWSVDTRGNAVALDWSACTLPSSGLANPGCTDGTGNGLIGLGSGETLSMVVPTLDPSVYGPVDATYGVYLPILLHAAAGGDTVDTIYRLRVRVAVAPGCNIDPPFSPGCTPNNNPGYQGIEPLPDESVGPTPTKKDEIWGLLADYSDGSMETYKVPSTVDPSVPEALRTQWFSTAGTFPNQPVGGTAVQSLKMDHALPPIGGIIDLWVVAHDGRGGTGIAHRAFVLQ